MGVDKGHALRSHGRLSGKRRRRPEGSSTQRSFEDRALRATAQAAAEKREEQLARRVCVAGGVLFNLKGLGSLWLGGKSSRGQLDGGRLDRDCLVGTLGGLRLETSGLALARLHACMLAKLSDHGRPERERRAGHAVVQSCAGDLAFIGEAVSSKAACVQVQLY